jgi:hypothetical protein
MHVVVFGNDAFSVAQAWKTRRTDRADQMHTKSKLSYLRENYPNEKITLRILLKKVNKGYLKLNSILILIKKKYKYQYV